MMLIVLVDGRQLAINNPAAVDAVYEDVDGRCTLLIGGTTFLSSLTFLEMKAALESAAPA